MENTTGQRHRSEEVLRRSDEEHHGHKNDADGERRDERGEGDFPRTLQHRLPQGTAELDMPVDVLNGDRRLIDQDADGQSQAAKRHDVE